MSQVFVCYDLRNLRWRTVQQSGTDYKAEKNQCASQQKKVVRIGTFETTVLKW